MTAEIVSVGTELLLGQIVDTHAPKMARILAECGLACNRRQTVGDNLERLTESLSAALERSDVVITIGGLGPTQDDLTREGIAAAFGVEFKTDATYEEKLRQFFAARRAPWVDSNTKQAMKPDCGRFIDNPNGTAPGLIVQKDGKTVVSLPGPAHEFNPMAEGPVRELLESLSGEKVIYSQILRTCGLGESLVEERIKDCLSSTNPTVAPYAHPSEVHLRITASAPTREEAQKLIAPMEARIRSRLGDAVYGVGEQTLEEAVVEMLKARSLTVSVAESVTGGWLGMRWTSVSGSGDVFLGGMITYDLGVKENLLGVKTSTLDAFGPVSEETAREMAHNVREMLKSDYGLSLTGNAGPTADVDEKPVGLVYIGLSGPHGIKVREYRLRGSRNHIRQQCTQLALIQLRGELLATQESHR
jgi:nicotinamide-nucleotide amidase